MCKAARELLLQLTECDLSANRAFTSMTPPQILASRLPHMYTLPRKQESF
jgi:hypothetical protein